jgi:hypothetical protein
VYILIQNEIPTFNKSVPKVFEDRAGAEFVDSIEMLKGNYAMFAVHPLESDKPWLCTQHVPVPADEPRENTFSRGTKRSADEDSAPSPKRGVPSLNYVPDFSDKE